MMLRDCKLGKKVLVLVALVMLIGVTSQPVMAQTDNCIPEDATIDSATLSLYVTRVYGHTVEIHRINAPWEELSVTWNSFMGAYEAFVENSFLVDSWDWVSVDVTPLVQDWVDGVYQNHGMLLETDLPYGFTEFHSSEYGDVSLRPMLEICYTTSTGSTCVVIQRPGAEQDGVADAHITPVHPDDNTGANTPLRTGVGGRGVKQLLIRFEICFEPPNGDGFCPGTPGYWKNRPEEWPVDTLVLGCETYTQAELLVIFALPTNKDASIIFSHHLIAAKLNILAGADATALVTGTIADADALLCTYDGKLPYEVGKKDPNRDQMLDLKDILDDYNNDEFNPGCMEY